MNTPWGMSQQVKAIADGVIWVSTAGHGGIMARPGAANISDVAKSRLFTPAYRGWLCFEEDEDINIFIFENQELFAERQRTIAESCLPLWYRVAANLPVRVDALRKRITQGERWGEDVNEMRGWMIKQEREAADASTPKAVWAQGNDGGPWHEFGSMTGTDSDILAYLDNIHAAYAYRIDKREYVVGK